MKALLNAFHDLVHKICHVLLIPVVAVLKSLTALLNHLLAEIEKI